LILRVDDRWRDTQHNDLILSLFAMISIVFNFFDKWAIGFRGRVIDNERT